MSSRKALWVSVCAFTVFLLLWFLRLFHVLGSEADILIGWVSTISLILCGVFIGIFISEKKIEVRGMLVSLLLFVAGFFAAPFVGVGVLMVVSMFPFSRGIEPIVFGGSITGYLLLYLGLIYWLRKKGFLKISEIDSTEK